MHVFPHVSLHVAKPEPPKFIVSIESLELPEGQDAHFFCKAFGRPVPEILWHRKGHDIGASNRIVIRRHRVENNSESTLIVVDIVPEIDDGVYVAEAINEVGHEVCEAQLTGKCTLAQNPEKNVKRYIMECYSTALPITEPPAFAQLPESIEAVFGETVEFRCSVTGRPSPQLTWQRLGKELTEGTGVHVTQAVDDDDTKLVRGALAIEWVDPEAHDGTYIAEATNIAGTVSHAAELVGKRTVTFIIAIFI